jgi:hypothetical protein
MSIAEAVSFALGGTSILLGLLAIWLSIHFYTRDQALFVETQRTLADIQHTARSVEHATELVLAKAIDYLTNRAASGDEGARLGDAVNREFARTMQAASTGRGAEPEITPHALDELRRAIEHIIGAYAEQRAAQDQQRAFWSGTVTNTREALEELRACDDERSLDGAHDGRTVS